MNNKKLHIKATLANPETWFSKFAERVDGLVVGNRLQLDLSIGSGYISNNEMQPGLSYITADVWLNIDFVYERVFKPGEEYYLVVIGLSPGPILSHSDGEEIIFDTYDHFKAIIISPNTPTTLYVKNQESLRMLNIFVSKQWIEDNIMDPGNKEYIRQILESDAPLALTEEFDYIHREMIKALFNSRYRDKIQKLSAVVSIISFLVKSISERLLRISNNNMESQDEEAIKRVCTELKNKWISFPSIQELARVAKMGESSFKAKFKRYTGISPYQYYLKIKLAKAMDFLVNTEMSVSEIGYACGYSNLSHFSRQFKKEFGMLPNEIQKRP